jgi:hypothetical protein
MPAVQLSSVVSLPDVLQLNHFSLLIASPPGGGDGSVLHVRNLTAQLPEKSHTVLTIDLHRFKTHQLGKPSWGEKFTAKYVETSDTKVIQAFRAWQNQISDSVTGLPKPRVGYITRATVTIYGADNQPAEVRTYFNLACAKVSAINLDGKGDSVMEYEVDFVYDYWAPGGI